MSKAVLVLEDGTYFTGRPLGAQGETCGEVVFNTCMTGYQEILTDPSYRGQMVTMTYPLCGNYGVNGYDSESRAIQAEGFIVKEACEAYSGSSPAMSLGDFLKSGGVTGIEGIDTRALTKHIRSHGSMFGIISTETGHVDVLLEKLRRAMTKQRNLVAEVSCSEIRHYPGKGKKVVVMDFGCKENILKNLKKFDCDMVVVPHDTSHEKILAFNPDGIMISNGPGDPAALNYAVENIKKLIGAKPVWGICLGQQLLGLALGGKTYKLPFGHHGGNHAVKRLSDGRCFITSQNHNYALEHDFSKDAQITEINVNDGTVEGFAHKTLPVKAVQYHPEAGPGPQESSFYFNDFIASI